MKTKPIIHIYVLCWNEEKMIPFFFRHYGNLADRIFVYDNQSTDSTIELLSAYDNVTIRTYKSEGTIRDDFYLTIKNHEWKKSRGIADIVIVCDMDEFIYYNDLETFLINFNESDSAIIKPIGYNMIIDTFDFTQNENLTDIVTTGVRNIDFDKMCVFKPDKVREINYSPGCHIASPSGNIKIFDIKPLLLHYKYLGLDYFLNKMDSYKLRLSDYNKKYRLGFQYEHEQQKHINYFNDLLSESSKVI